MTEPLPGFLADRDWKMSAGERAALEGVLSFLKPRLAVEIGTLAGGSLECMSRHSEAVHSFDLDRHPHLTRERFPNVTFHTGDSHTLLPSTLRELAANGDNVDFALVDGDHSAGGVRRDLQDLLDSSTTQRTVILLHDTLNERVRAGVRSALSASDDKVRFVDLDFVVGQVVQDGEEQRLWGGFGIVVTGWPVSHPTESAGYDTLEVFTAYLSTLGRDRIETPSYDAFRDVEVEIVAVRESIAKMERSLSWRITSPLRLAKRIITRAP